MMPLVGGLLLTSLKGGVLVLAVIMCLMLVLPCFHALSNPTTVTNRSDKVNAQVYADPQSLADSKAYWLNLATNAWQYYQPNNGVNSATGLESNAVGSNQFTDWDLGTYVQAIVETEKLGILSADGAWGANARIDKVLTFLEQRPLINDPGQPDNGQPYAWYYADLPYRSVPGSAAQVAWDAGNLLVALKNVENYGPTASFKSRIDAIVYSRTNYEPEAQTASSLASSYGPDVYHYYLALGFGTFFDNYNGWTGFAPTNFTSEAKTILNNTVNSPSISMGLPTPYNGVTLPKADILCEPLLLAIFGFQQPDPALLSFSRQVYLVQEARYNATGKFTAFSEGGATGQYVYEWIVFSNGDTWEVRDTSYNVLSISPVVYLKVALSFMALYNTTYSQSLVGYLIPHIPPSSNGYSCGVDEMGTIIYDVEDKTNSMIISAARYAIENNVTLPASLPTPAPSQPSSSSPSNTGPVTTANSYSAPIPTIAPQQSNTPILAPSPGSSQTSSSEPSPTSTPSTSPATTENQTNPTASPSTSNTPLSSTKLGAPWQTNPVIILAIVVVVAIAVILPVIILRRNGSTRPH